MYGGRGVLFTCHLINFALCNSVEGWGKYPGIPDGCERWVGVGAKNFREGIKPCQRGAETGVPPCGAFRLVVLRESSWLAGGVEM